MQILKWGILSSIYLSVKLYLLITIDRVSAFSFRLQDYVTFMLV